MGQAADAVSAYTPVQMEDAPRLLRKPKSECPDTWIRLPRDEWPRSWTNMVVPLERNVYGHLLSGLLWERAVWRSSVQTWMGWSTELGNVFSFIENKDTSCQKMWMTSKYLERSRIRLPRGRNWWWMLIRMNQHHSLTSCIWDVLNVNANRIESLLSSTKRCLNHVYLLEQLKSYQGGENLRQKQLRGPMTRKDLLKHALSDIASWQTRRQSSCAKSPVLAWMITTSRRTWISWKIPTCMLTNCFAILVPCMNWKTRHFMVCQQTC